MRVNQNTIRPFCVVSLGLGRHGLADFWSAREDLWPCIHECVLLHLATIWLFSPAALPLGCVWNLGRPPGPLWPSQSRPLKLAYIKALMHGNLHTYKASNM